MKKAAKVLFVLAVVFASLAVVLQGVLGMLVFAAQESIVLSIASGLSVAMLGMILLIVGWALDSSKNDVVHRLGIGFHVAGMAMLTTIALVYLLGIIPFAQVDGLDVMPLDSILILVALVLYAIAWFLVLLVHASKRGCSECKGEALNPEEDVHVAAIMKWKKLYNEGIITEREFIDKRNEILGLRK